MTVEWFGEDQFYAALKSVMKDVDAASSTIVDQGSMMIVRAAQANFSGTHAKDEPHVGGNKPNIVTGDLRRSIMADSVTRLSFANYSVTIAPRMVYGRRVELGFVGADSLGRNYNTPGYPYFMPGVHAVLPDLQYLAAKTWGQVFKR